MKYFVAILFLSAGAMAKTMPMAGKMYMPAEAREATFTPGSYDGFDPSYSSATFSPAPQTGFGIGGNFDIGFPGLLNTLLTVGIVLFGFSVLVQLVSKIVKIPFIDSIVSDNNMRSLNMDDLNQLGVFAADAIHRLQELYEGLN